MPNLTDGKTLKGTNSSQYHGLSHTGGLPDIQGWMNLTQNQVEATGDGNAFYRINPGAVYVHVNQTTTEGRTVGFLASRSNNIYGRTTDKVEPYGYWMYYLIKYI